MRIIRSVIAFLLFTAMLVVSQAGTAVASSIYTGPPPIVDGYLDPLYASSFSTIDYTQTGASPSVITGQIAVIETADAYYIGFQQSLNRQSNAYCGNTNKKTNNTPGCYHAFKDLVGSDHISFEWANLGGKPVDIGVDIITANSAAQFGYSGMVKTPLTGNIGEGDRLTGCPDPHGVTGFSGEDWNWHHAGGGGYGADPSATVASPNFAGTSAQYPDYNYASTAEVRIDKALCQIPGGLDLAGTVNVIAHNSPPSPLAVNPSEFLVCAAGNPSTGTLGTESVLDLSVLKFDANGNTIPNGGRSVIASIASGAGTITSVNGVAGATSGVSDATGMISVGVTSSTAGTVSLRGVLDLNGNGVWDQPAEPSTNPTCPIDFAGSSPISVELVKTNNADGLGSYSKAEVAPRAGADVPFHLEIRNPSTVSITITGLTDTWPGHGIDNVCPELINRTLAPYVAANNGPVLTCGFTVTGYAPAAGSAPKVNTAHVDAVSVLDPAKTASAEDTSSVTVKPVISVELVKTNDANRDGQYHDAEIAPVQGATVPFKAVIHNLSAVPVRIDTLTDAVVGATSLTPICDGLIGTTLQPNGQAGDSQTCLWPVPNYAPAPTAGAKLDIAAVTVSQIGDPTNTASDQDTSAVTTPNPDIAVDLVKTNDANRDGVYNDAEVAPAESADVPFRAVITNTGPVAVQLLTLTDEFPGHAAGPICSNLVAAPTVLQPGAHVTCEWTEPGYAWAPNLGAKLNVARVTVGQVGNLAKTASANDSSAVTTPSALISVALIKTNDANRDGQYHDAEVAPTEGADVPFRALITNTSKLVVRIDQLNDLLPGHTQADDICNELVGTELQPGGTATCDWTESGYAGAPDDPAKVNTATVVVSQVGDPDNTATADDTSAVTTSPAPPAISITVVKTNNANGDTVYSDDETGTTGASVPFRAVITNTSSVPVVIDSITDVWPGTAAVDECAALVGTTLQPGKSVTCDFTVANYVPAASAGAKVDTVTVKAHQANNPNNTTSANDVSTVRGAAPPAVLGETVVRAPTLPRTGSDSNVGLGLGLGLIGLGSMLVLMAHGSRRLPYAAPSAPVLYNIRPPVIEHNLTVRTSRAPVVRRWRR